jgi:hypothetical protein
LVSEVFRRSMEALRRVYRGLKWASRVLDQEGLKLESRFIGVFRRPIEV